MQKSMENTVFVRFDPTPQHKVMRHELEDIFSQAGPIKKSSWINTKGATAPSGDGEDYQRGTTGRSSKGYGFIRYISQEDAVSAQKELNNSKIQMDGKNYTLKVELASLSAAANSKAAKANYRGDKKGKDTSSSTDATSPESEEAVSMLKKKSRIILRNLSFYAKENHIRTAMESNFGKVLDIHLPKVKANLHVGFCFVTFENPKDAQKAVETKRIDIKKRAVNMDWSLPKKHHQQQKEQERLQKEKEQQKIKEERDENDEDDDATSNSDSESESSDSDDESRSSSNSSENDNDDSDDDTDDDSDDDKQENAVGEDSDNSDDTDDNEEEPEDDSVGKKCCLFLRNLPFDATRHDLFQLLYKFGHIKGIYLVKDRATGMLKGTAFVTYSNPKGAKRAMEFAASSSTSDTGGTPFVSQRQNAGTSNEGIDDASQIRGSLMLKGRKILVDMAVDKETAATFDSKEYKIPQADRRNLYLQAEARVESSSSNPKANNTDTWDDLPQQDQRKRQTALKDKTAKLQSPIFFINPNRLSFRNMGKHVNEAGLQKLIELATKRGLAKRLVSVEDQIAHWRALGEMTTREILAKVQQIEGQDRDIIPPWSYDDEEEENSNGETKSKRRKNIKDFIPSVYIDRDFGPSGKKADAPSRGFGFAEFTHHTHALACLRELNNNPAYSKDYAAGGKAADALKKRPQRKNKKGFSNRTPGDYRDDDGKVHIPRLIVDFVVENKVKAKKQAERRLQQQLNQSKQQLEQLEKKKEKDGAETSTKKKGRGAIQREKKRKKRESGEEEAERQRKLQKKALYEAKKEMRKERAEEKKRKAEELKRKSMKPPKKKKSQQKRIEDDEEFENIVRTYQSKLESARDEKVSKTNPREAVREKRWFE